MSVVVPAVVVVEANTAPSTSVLEVHGVFWRELMAVLTVGPRGLSGLGLVPAALALVVTLSALSPSFRCSDGVIRGELMSTLTVGSGGFTPSPDVLRHGAGFQMFRIDAESVSAEVVKREPFWNGADKTLIDEPMSLVRPLLVGDVPIAAWVGCSSPNPTWAKRPVDSVIDCIWKVHAS